MNSFRCLRVTVAVVAIVLACISPAFAKDKVIGRFDLKHGANPQAELVADAKGNLFGVAPTGGANSCGVVFELSPTSGGSWAETVIYSFKGGIGDGCSPSTQLVFDSRGNLFGGTSTGGNNSGTIFELTPAGGAGWSEKTVYIFTGPSGQVMGPQLAIDSAGNLFGSLRYGGSSGFGTIFAVHPQGSTWTEELLWQFNGPDGAYPLGGVLLDSEGNLFGTTWGGGAPYTRGTVFELSPKSGGAYSLQTIYNFPQDNDWGYPQAALAIDASGNLYGVSSSPPPPTPSATPVAFELSPVGNDWKIAILYTFAEWSARFSRVYGSPSGFTLDAAGNLYGVTNVGGTQCNLPGCGVVYELSPPTSGSQWSHKVLYQFEGAEDGSYPVGNVLLYNNQIYGTTEYGGGMYGYGTVFSVAP